MTTTIYTTPTCSYCKTTKEYFDEHKVQYTAIDVVAHPDKAQEMMQKSGQMGVPVTVIAQDDGTEKVIVGFDQAALAAALGI